MRLIDADELKTAFPCGEYVRTESVRATIDHAPTVTQRMRGRWEDAHRYGWNGIFWFIKCDNCGYERKDDNHDLDTEYKFCPSCGAQMDGGE